MDKFLKILLIGLGGGLIAYAAILLTTVNVSIGAFIPMFIGAPLLLYGIFYSKLKVFTKKGIGRVLKIVFIALYGAFLVFFCVTLCFMFSYTESSLNSKVDALIVLGSGLKQNKPSATLARRLDKAVEYYNANKDTILVVTGGLGKGKQVSEAHAMEEYLMEKQVPKGRIIKEEKATDTDENFLYSKRILDDYFKREYKVGFATSDFHAYRADLIAREFGYTPEIYTNETVWYYAPSAVIRECFSIFFEWFID